MSLKEHLIGLCSDGVVSIHTRWPLFSSSVPTWSVSKVHLVRTRCVGQGHTGEKTSDAGFSMWPLE